MSKLIGVVAIFISVFSLHLMGQETWKITSLDWQPYSGGKLADQGTSVKKLREILREEGVRLVVEFYPWQRAQILAKNKGYIGYFPAWPEEVSTGFVASQVVDWSEIAILKKTGTKLVFSSIDELFKKYSVGIVSTYEYPEIINKSMKKYPFHVDGARNETQLVKKLSAGRHNAALTDPAVMMHLAKKNSISNVELVDVISKKELVIALRDDVDNQEKIKFINRVLKSLNK